jgi:hypothetical protein
MAGGIIGGHLGSRVSALLDGQLPAAEEERAWAHVHGCHVCRDQVEREGWVKRRLAGLTFDDTAAMPAALKGSLLQPEQPHVPLGDVYLGLAAKPRRTTVGLAALGGGAVGAAMMGVLALGAAPASAPTIERPGPTASTSPGSSPGPVVASFPPRRDGR